MVLGRDGQGTRRDSPAIFCPGPACPAGQLCGTVPRKFVPVQLVPQTSVPVPVPRDTKSVWTDRDSRPAGQSRKSRHILVEKHKNKKRSLWELKITFVNYSQILNDFKFFDFLTNFRWDKIDSCDDMSSLTNLISYLIS